MYPRHHVCIVAQRPLLALGAAVEQEPLGPEGTVEPQTSMIQVGQKLRRKTLMHVYEVIYNHFLGWLHVLSTVTTTKPQEK